MPSIDCQFQVETINTVDCCANPDVIYRLPANPQSTIYQERVDRNRGWLAKAEQAALRDITIGVAGCGGMGGLLAQVFLRLGVGCIKIADIEPFDVTNLNRQAAAVLATVGQSKAFATAQLLRATCDDAELVVYPMGITDGSVEHFVNGCDLIFAEIEIFALDPYVLLHQVARRLGVTLFDGLVIGFGTNLFKYEPTSMPVEQMLGFVPAEAREQLTDLLGQAEAGDRVAIERICSIILNAFVPNLPSYIAEDTDRVRVLSRLSQGQASIVATTPPFATGAIAIRALLELLSRMGHERRTVITPMPLAPDFVSCDLGTLTMHIVERPDFTSS